MDIVDKATRSRIMASIRSSGTGPERLAADALRRLGIKFRANCGGLPGSPDFLLLDFAVALFVDGCFWHGCPFHYRPPRTNRAFWEAKVRRNRERDREVDARLAGIGIVSVRIWEHDVRRDPVGAVADALALAGIPVRRPAPSGARAPRPRAS